MSPQTASGLTGWLRGRFATLRHYHRVAEVGEIARRYFAMNAFDGVLTTLGVLVGSYIGHVHSAHQVVAVGLGAAVAMGVSGFYGSYLIERAERDRSLRELEDVTLSSLEDSDIAAASTYATIVIAARRRRVAVRRRGAHADPVLPRPARAFTPPTSPASSSPSSSCSCWACSWAACRASGCLVGRQAGGGRRAVRWP